MAWHGIELLRNVPTQWPREASPSADAAPACLQSCAWDRTSEVPPARFATTCDTRQRVIHVLFPLGVRLSTILTAVAFAGLAVARRDTRPLLACWLWLTTFEAAFQIASLVMDRLPLGVFSPLFFLSLAVVSLFFTRAQVRPDWRYLAAALLVIAVWMATGFHLNGHQHGMFSLHTRIPDFDATAEVMNEVAKTLWALGYFLPLVRRPWPEDECVAVSAIGTGR